MTIDAKTVDEYISKVPAEKTEAISKLRETIRDNLPTGFEEGIGYKMIAYYVPQSKYPAGYHCDPQVPLPFINIASQKNFIALYHSGIYADKNLLNWFVAEYPKHIKTKLDMGKSCIRFKKVENIPYDLIGELCQKMSAEEWIALYEKNVKR